MRKCKSGCGGKTKLKMKAGGSTSGKTIPLYDNNPRTQGRILKKGGSSKSFPDLTGDGKVTKADILKGRGVPKAKFGVSVPVQRSPAPGRVRSASGVGTVPVGKRKKLGGVSKRK
jgi:hypothetical protein